MRRLWIAALVLLAAFSWAGTHGGNTDDRPKQGKPKEILFLHSLGYEFQPWATWTRSIRHELNSQSPWPLNFEEQSLVTALRGNDGAEPEFVAYLKALYAQRKLDLIVAIGGPAARFVQKYRAELFPATPMLLAAVEVRRVEQSMLSMEDTVVATRVDHTAVFKNILRLLPDTKQIAMIIGNSPGERLWIDDIQRELKPLLGDRVALRFYYDLPFDKLLAELSNLPPRSAIFFQQLMVDGSGAVFGDKDPLRLIAEVANAPIFTQDQSFFVDGVVGGPMSSPADAGRIIAGVAIRILGGERANDIHLLPIEFSTPKYDWRQLQRWNISESRLPPDSRVLFREQSAWERYSWQISLIAMALLLQAGFIAILLRERQRRHLAEVKAQQRMSELARVNRFSTAGELSALIAHEINQPLGAILSNAEAAQIILNSSKPDLPMLSEIVSEILHNDERAAEVIRRMRSLLKKAPFELRHFDLNDLTREAIGFLSPLARGRKIELVSSITAEPLPVLGDRVQLQQVILNLVMNAIDAMKNSEKRTIDIRTSRAGDVALLTVSDSGPGIPGGKLKKIFEPFFTTKPDGMGMGLSIARTIVEAHNGQIRATNQDGGGATFQMKLPLV
ncbi:MAG TPA: sensor histidine kinase, partial [Rhizobiaceae bacterium]